MRIRVLGGLSVDGVAERDLGSRKARGLLKVLALARGAPVSVDRIAEVLWGDEQPLRPAEQVGVLVSRLRRVLGADRIRRTDAGYALVVDWLDADELAVRALEAGAALAAGRIGAARAAAQAALTLARGSVLPEEDGEWVEAERAACASLTAVALRVSAEAAERAGDPLAAVAAAERALAHDPYDEATLRILMRSHLAAARPASALAAYIRVRDRLVEDLGVSPTAATEALHDAIVLDEPPAAPSTRSSLPGRAAALALLDDALDRAAGSPTPVGVEVVGEGGIGKTALVEHWCRVTQARVSAFVGRCDVLGRDLPLQPIVDAIAAQLASLDEDARAALLRADADVLGALLGVDHESATVVRDHDVGRTRLFTASLALVTRLAKPRIPVLVVDDVHLAGESTRSWLRFVLRRPGRMLVVASGRPPVTVLDTSTRIVLGPLDLDAVRSIVGEERATALHARSGGHPLLLTALASGADPRSETVQEAVARRLEDLGAATATLRTAAVLGSEVDLDLLAEVLHMPAVDLLSHLEAAVAAGLLVERGTGFAFRHELERESLDATVGAARRALVHGDAARALAARTSADPLVVAVHARLGGDAGLAATWLVRAAEVATARHDTDEAAAHLDLALELTESSTARAARARLHVASGRLAEAADDAAMAVAGAGDAAALEVSGWVAYYQRRYDEALAFADAALVRATDPALRVSCLALAGRVHHAAGSVGEALGCLEPAVEVEAPPAVLALAGVWLAHTRVHQGRPADAVALLDRALVDPDRLAHPFASLHGGFARVMALGQLGRASDALRACDALDGEVLRRGDAGARMAAPAANVRAWLLRWTGNPAEADDLNERAVADTDPDGLRAEAYYAAVLDLADGRLLAGDDAGAWSLLRRLAPIEHWSGTMAWHQRHRWSLLRARLELRDGNADGAAALSGHVAADAGARGAGRYEAFARGLHILAGGDDAGVEHVVARLRRCAALDGVPLIEALIARAR